MNLLLSYNWLREFAATDLSPQEFAKQISLSGPAVERISNLAKPLDLMVVGRISEIRSHPNADKLKVVIVDVGKELIDVVCGGSNLAVGQKVAFAKVGSKVRWHGEGDPIVLESVEIRGVKSFGMIAAANEIGLFEAFPHDEKEILDLSFLSDVAIGTSLAEALGLDDVLFDIEVSTNRVDALSTVGMARETAAILDASFQDKHLSAITKTPAVPKKDEMQLSVDVEEKDLCPRYQAIVIDAVKVEQAPWWIRRRLVQAGIRSISNVVDITNYVMLELGQPLHAFDYKELTEKSIVVRKAKKGEQLAALDENSYIFSGDELLIADAEKPIAIAGVMGGVDTGITEKTTSIVLEAATFDSVSVRKTARALNLHSDSSLRFEKGLSTEATSYALARAANLILEVCGGRVVSEVKDERAKDYSPRIFQFRPQKAEDLIGVSIPASKQVNILKSLGFSVQGKGEKLSVEVPWWRDQDIEAERDFTEEIARVWGYHNLPSVLPGGVPPVRLHDPVLELESDLKNKLCGAGLTEIISYSFVSRELLEKVGMGELQTVKVQNPITIDLAEMRPSLLPSMLQVIAENQETHSDAQLFEIANIYKAQGDELPEEVLSCLIAAYGPSPSGEQFIRIKGIMEFLLDELTDEYTFSSDSDLSIPEGIAHPARSVAIHVGNMFAGYVAEIHPAILEEFGINTRVAVAKLIPFVIAANPKHNQYTPPPSFPGVKRDLAFVIDARSTHADVSRVIGEAHPLIQEVKLFDVYTGKGVGEGKKSMAYHLLYGSQDHTLTAEEAEQAHFSVVDALKKTFTIDVRS